MSSCGSPAATRNARWPQGDHFRFRCFPGLRLRRACKPLAKHWSAWQPISEKLLLEKQSPDGSWHLAPGSDLEAQAGAIYTTALAILSLAVEFRYLPIYQR